MSISRLLDNIPRWLIAGSGLLIGILILSVSMRGVLVGGEEATLSMFAMVHFSGYLFFIISPVEILYVHMLGEPYASGLLFVVAVITALTAQAVDYGIGYSVSSAVITNIIGEKKYHRHLKWIHNYGGLMIFMVSLSPLSSPIVLLVAGMIRYPFRRAMVYSLGGLSIKYMALALIWVS